jgi:predicted transposase/invertase (TIGR01784 family)
MHRPVDRLDPKNDLVFKLLLTREPALLCDMLEAILARPIRDATVLNPTIPGQLASDKQIVLDIRTALDDGSRADLEMQVRLVPAQTSRWVYYSARDYADQLDRGDAYDQLTPTVVIAWLVEPLFPEIDRLHSIFELRERHTHTLFSDQLVIHVLQLSTPPSSRPTGYDARVARWARFLTASDDAEFDQLASEDPIMALAKETLDKLSQDPAARRLAREREDSLKLYRMHLIASRAEGEAKGRAEGEAKGRAEVLLELVGLRFGPPSEATRARIEAATFERLDAWVERLLTAESLDQALAP